MPFYFNIQQQIIFNKTTEFHHKLFLKETSTHILLVMEKETEYIVNKRIENCGYLNENLFESRQRILKNIESIKKIKTKKETKRSNQGG